MSRHGSKAERTALAVRQCKLHQKAAAVFSDAAAVYYERRNYELATYFQQCAAAAHYEQGMILYHLVMSK